MIFISYTLWFKVLPAYPSNTITIHHCQKSCQ
ncbi:hypothetical protein [Klebsiella phage vB_KpnM-VAC66]|nr:hypothetical protein [Klebsiella phage vB_KpnM-VAC66]